MTLAFGLTGPVWAAGHLVSTYEPVLERCEAERGGRLCVGRMAIACSEAEAAGGTTLGAMDCNAAEMSVWNQRLIAKFAGLRAVMEARGTLEPFLEAQRAWLAFRDAECRLARAQWGDGSFAGIAEGQCRMELTADRLAALHALGEGFQ